MVLVVLGVRAAHVSAGPLPPALALVIEVGAGGLGYLAAAAILARRASQELWARVRDALRPPAVD
jgi:hypothetical protein